MVCTEECNIISLELMSLKGEKKFRGQNIFGIAKFYSKFSLLNHIFKET